MAKLVQLKDSAGNIYPLAFEPGTLTSANDLDDIQHQCMVWCNNVGNKPSSNTYGWLFMPNSAIQIYFVFGNNGIANIYIRCYTNNQWYPWRYLSTTAIS